ncbi:MAG TPA: site-specific integrase [Candidatus Acidoferrum sp.]|nr:site-specific integrase [Candidatus Acidoferrum sp.]
MRLPDKIKELQKPKAELGTFKEARLLFEADLANDHTLAPASKYYRTTRIAALLKSWPGLDDEKLDRMASKDSKGVFKMRDEFQQWANRFSGKFDDQNFNNTLGTLRMILERGGLRRDDNPAYEIDRLGVKSKELKLPEPEQFNRMVEVIETAGAPQSKDCADLVRFLAFSGCRISEARQVIWADVDMERGEIKVRNAKRSITSNGAEFRYIPIIPPMRELVDRLKLSNPLPSQRVCVLGECEKSLTRACKVVGVSRITHHDMRHLFASRCIASGVDIPTISRWLGHSDGGALAMRVYGHLQREHSQKMAAKVSFGQEKPENVITLPKAATA